MQRITWDTGDAFAGVYKMIRENLFPHIFSGNTKTLSPIVGDLSTMHIKMSGMGLLNPVTSEKEKHLSSQRASPELIWPRQGEGNYPKPTTYGRSGKKARQAER